MENELKDLNILLIDDDPLLRTVVRDSLKAFEVSEVMTANNGAVGYDALTKFPADVVIVDWQMSSMNGMDFLYQVRNAADSPNPFVPIVMLTAYSEAGKVRQCRDAGVSEFLVKPVTPTALYKHVASAVINQRVFVRSATYFGPDRRRTTMPYTGVLRRKDDVVAYIDHKSSPQSSTRRKEDKKNCAKVTT